MRGVDINSFRWVRPFVVASLLLPRPVQHLLGIPVAGLLLLVMRGARAGVLSNLRRVLGPERATRARLILLAWKTFYQYGLSLLDIGAVASGSRERLRPLVGRVRGRERLVAALAEGRGAILVTPHLGNWELGGALLALDGRAPFVLEAAGGDAALRSFRARFRGRLGIEARLVDAGAAAGALSLVETAGVLRRGGVVAMLADRPSGTRDVPVAFFGGPQPFPAGPAALSHATGAPVFPVFVTLGRGMRYDLEVEAPIVVRAPDAARAGGASRAERERAIQEGTRAIAHAFERRVAAAPDQWYNFFPVFVLGREGRRSDAAWSATGSSSSGSTRGFDAAASASPA